MFPYLPADRRRDVAFENDSVSELRVRSGKGTAVIKRFLAVMAAATAVLGAGAGAALAAYPPDMQAGAVSATTVVPGGQVDFTGDGFADGSKVVVSVNKAVYATVTAGAASALGSRSSLHVTTAAFVRNASVVAAAAPSASFAVKVTLQTAGANVLTGAGVAPDGSPHMVTATVTVAGEAEAAKSTASGLPFTGSDVIIPGIIVGAVMVAGGFLMLTTVRSRKAGARS
jgi:hypothetical protein